MGFFDRGAVAGDAFFFAPALDVPGLLGAGVGFRATDFFLALDFACGFTFGLGFAFDFWDFGFALALGREGRAPLRAPEERLAVFFFAFFLLAIRLNTDSR